MGHGELLAWSSCIVPMFPLTLGAQAWRQARGAQGSGRPQGSLLPAPAQNQSQHAEPEKSWPLASHAAVSWGKSPIQTSTTSQAKIQFWKPMF